ncbi:MAG: ATP-dependent DNA helicase RecG [Rickettsiaceae bacterium]|nr:ATP-dependent DNA helicase RecG [Rickettsiaceae bacterium]
MYNIFFQKVTDFLPIKDTAKAALNRLGIEYVRDLLFYSPISYNINDTAPNLSCLQDKQLIQTRITIDEISVPKMRGRPTKIYVSNETGSMILVFFNKIPAFIFAKLKIGSSHIVAGKVQHFDRMVQMTHPEFIFRKELSVSVEPVYPLTYGIINKQLYGYIIEAIKAVTISIKAKTNFGAITEIVTNEEDTSNECLLNEKLYMESLLTEIKQLHLIGVKPQEMTEAKLNFIVEKLATKELFANQLSLLKLKQEEKTSKGRKFIIDKETQQQILVTLGFELTQDQEKVIAEIEQDQVKERQMMRLLQGDVGSGKTLVALLTIINVVKSKQQVAFMAPTDLLSMQHYQFLQKALQHTNINIALLTGKTRIKARREIKADLADGTINILIGTHALFQEGVDFQDLGFVIIDEQHRFGVEQRLELINKASHPDVLVMTATPIPRSLTLTIFGDMESSQIKTKPKNRLPITTTVTSLSKKISIIGSLAKKLDQGEKIYWVCPLIDPKDTSLETETETENIDDDNNYADVTTRFQELNEHYPGQVGLLHGRLKEIEKEKLMQDFKAGTLKILVTTTVIEVGIDVPDSTLMIIENAEKFGLAQLHQLRGRVGRGTLKSYCILLYNPKRFSKLARKRLEIMRNSNDGFYIAEQDLILRGGGEILGTKQSGEPDFFFADLARDLKILLAANKLASKITHDDFAKFQIELFAKDRLELIKSG